MKIYAELSIHLFGKPAWELAEGEPVTPTQLRELADELKDRLYDKANLIQKLNQAGFTSDLMLYDIGCSKEFDSKEEAETLLKKLEIDLEDVMFFDGEGNEWDGTEYADEEMEDDIEDSFDEQNIE